jgi:hypothetical protein
MLAKFDLENLDPVNRYTLTLIFNKHIILRQSFLPLKPTSLFKKQELRTASRNQWDKNEANVKSIPCETRTRNLQIPSGPD